MEKTTSCTEPIGERLREYTTQFANSLEQMHTLTAHMLERMPVRSFSFRGGANSQQAYSALCPYLVRIEERKRELQMLTLDIAGLRDELASAFVHLSTDLLSKQGRGTQNEEERMRQKELMEQIGRLVATVQEFDRNVLRRYLHALSEASDAEHDGKGCNVSKICELGGVFCERLILLSKEIKSRLS